MEFDWMIAVLQLIILAFSVIVHEVAHGYVAYRLGDPTAKAANRLTLNPLDHIDLFGSVILPLYLLAFQSPVMFAWAKPVPVNPAYFRKPKRDNVLVSVAGVTMNLALAVCAGVLFRIIRPEFGGVLWLFLVQACAINVVLAAFNMVPIPPLDGSHVLAAFLPWRMAQSYMELGRYGFLVIFALLYLRVLDLILMPIWKAFRVVLLGL